MTKFAGALQRCEEVLVAKVYPQLPLDDGNGIQAGDIYDTIGQNGLPSREAGAPAGGVMADKIRRAIEDSQGKLRVINTATFFTLRPRTKYQHQHLFCRVQ